MAGGSGSRLAPTTLVVNKHLLPIFDKPMIFYSLSLLMLAGIRHIVLICNKTDEAHFRLLFGDGRDLGINLEFRLQNSPNGIADAYRICKDVTKNRKSMLVLGDNLLFGAGLTNVLNSASQNISGSTIFGYRVKDPSAFGVIETDTQGKPISILEKPSKPKSDIAVTGVYFFDETASERVSCLQRSKRGELEITDLAVSYLKDKKLKVEIFGRGIAWLDTGTPSSMLEASQFVEVVETRQGTKIACLEEIALNNNWIGYNEIKQRAEIQRNSNYGKYLNQLADSIHPNVVSI